MKKFFVYAIIIMAIGVYMSCKKPVTGADRDKVLAYANPISDGILRGYNEGNYAMYSKDFTEQMKNSLPEKVFAQTREMILSKIGKYMSRDLSDVYLKDRFTVVLYKGVFEKEKEVEIKVVFESLGDKNLVSGLWFNSPKLREK